MLALGGPSEARPWVGAQTVPDLPVCRDASPDPMPTALSAGPFFLMSALMINVLKHQPFNDGHLILGTFVPTDFTAPFYIEKYNESLSVVAATTFLTGMIQVGPCDPCQRTAARGPSPTAPGVPVFRALVGPSSSCVLRV